MLMRALFVASAPAEGYKKCGFHVRSFRCHPHFIITACPLRGCFVFSHFATYHDSAYGALAAGGSDEHGAGLRDTDDAQVERGK